MEAKSEGSASLISKTAIRQDQYLPSSYLKLFDLTHNPFLVINYEWNNTHIFRINAEFFFKLFKCFMLYFVYTGLFRMIVGVLTTDHIQYTWDRSICIFYLIEQHSTFLLHTLQVLYMCTLCDSTNINTIIEFVPNCL